MRTTLDIDVALLDQAANAVREDRLRRNDASPISRTAVIELGLRALIRQLVSERLAAEFEDGITTKTPRRRRTRS